MNPVVHNSDLVEVPQTSNIKRKIKNKNLKVIQSDIIYLYLVIEFGCVALEISISLNLHNLVGKVKHKKSYISSFEILH